MKDLRETSVLLHNVQERTDAALTALYLILTESVADAAHTYLEERRRATFGDRDVSKAERERLRLEAERLIRERLDAVKLF